ncbi:MAG: VWA domain-containing protein [Clostridia bacterium]|nr:VWA domain-containing protein [Clostridia bacterium]
MNIMGDFIYKKAKPLPVILLLDTSGSMADGDHIGTLNRAVQEMLRDFRKAANNEASISVAMITFCKEQARVYQPLADVNEIDIDRVRLEAYGMTPMGDAIRTAKAMIEDKEQIPSRAYRPTVVLVSDGAPTDDWKSALDAFMAKDARSAKCYRMAMGIGVERGTAEYDVLRQFVSSEEQVFEATDASEISKFFQYVTISTTARTVSANPNLIPARADLSSTLNTKESEDDDDDLDGLLPF